MACGFGLGMSAEDADPVVEVVDGNKKHIRPFCSGHAKKAKEEENRKKTAGIH